jgi:hypothetical protein
MRVSMSTATDIIENGFKTKDAKGKFTGRRVAVTVIETIRSRGGLRYNVIVGEGKGRKARTLHVPADRMAK